MNIFPVTNSVVGGMTRNAKLYPRELCLLLHGRIDSDFGSLFLGDKNTFDFASFATIQVNCIHQENINAEQYENECANGGSVSS